MNLREYLWDRCSQTRDRSSNDLGSDEKRGSLIVVKEGTKVKKRAKYERGRERERKREKGKRTGKRGAVAYLDNRLLRGACRVERFQLFFLLFLDFAYCGKFFTISNNFV